MPNLEETLKLKRCPHCSVDNPNLMAVLQEFKTSNDSGNTSRIWKVYRCARCGGVVTASCSSDNRFVKEIYPNIETVNDVLPKKVKSFLQQAIDSAFAPAGSVMLCASAVDAILKEKGYIDGSLHSRINKAADTGLLTKEMATWAHQVRLDANDQRHSDEEAELPTIEDAKQTIEFTKTLAEFIFVLPSKVSLGLKATQQMSPNPKDNSNLKT